MSSRGTSSSNNTKNYGSLSTSSQTSVKSGKAGDRLPWDQTAEEVPETTALLQESIRLARQTEDRSNDTFNELLNQGDLLSQTRDYVS